MKTFSLLLLFFHPLATLAGSHFTTVFYDDEGVVYLGLKHGEGKGESQVVTFPFPSGPRTRIPLPEEISHRDVIGLITEKKKLFVLTGANTEKKEDGPSLHMFDRGKNQWKKIGKLGSCPTFTKVKISPKKMVFFCDFPAKNGRSRVIPKSLFLGRERIYRYGTWRFPEFMLRFKGVALLLEGRAPTWDKLRLKSDEIDRVMTAEDLFAPPAPLPSSEPNTTEAKAQEEE